MKNALMPLAKSALLPLGWTAAASATDEIIQKKNYGSGMTTLIMSKKEMKYIIEQVKYLKESGLLNKGVSKTIENEAKNKKVDFSAC